MNLKLERQMRGMGPTIGLMAALLGVGVAVAQTPSGSDTAAPEQSGKLAEIVVTAQRREENLQKVPVSVTALTAADLEHSNITSTPDLQQVTPGLTWTSANRTALPYIRGIGSSDISVGSESSVALYVDGIYIESSPAATLPLNNVDRVEVLKGPQGTLFGRNATGGLIQIITKQPSQTPGGDFEIGYGSYDDVQAAAYLTGPISKTISADVAATYNDQSDGWGHNVDTGRKIDIDRTYSLRSKWLFDFDDTKFTLGGDYADQRTDIGSERNIFPGFLGVGRTNPLADFYNSQSNLNPMGELSTGGINLHAEHAFGFADFTSITSYRHTHFQSLLDVDETPLSVLALGYHVRIEAFTQELQLVSRSQGPLTWIGGAFYMHREGEQPSWTVSGLAVEGPYLGFSNVVDGVTSDVIAPYGQATWRLASDTELTAGARYTVEHQYFTGTQTNALDDVIATVDSSITYRQPTYRLAINQNITDHLMAYLSYNRGFKSGVYNVASLRDPPAQPEIVNAYEEGFKTDLFDQRLRINGAAYQYDYHDIQLAVPKGPSASTINAAQARIRGAELSMDVVPVRRLTLSLGASYMPTATYTNFSNAPSFVPAAAGGNALTSFNDSGGRMVRAPEFTGTAAVGYLASVGRGDIDISANYYHSGSFLWNIDGREIQSAYSLVNGQISYKDPSGYRVSVWADNIFDQRYMSGASETTAGNVYSPGPPRTIGIKFGYTF